jgi:outer membrane protein assembly factor BamB
MVIVVGHNQKMAAYDLRKGERLWERHIGGTRTPAVIGDYIFIINSHNELVCLTAKYGQVVWVKKLDSHPELTSRVIWEGPLVAGGNLYLVSALGTLITVDPANGKTLSERSLGASVSIAPFAAQDRLYILTAEGELRAF